MNSSSRTTWKNASRPEPCAPGLAAAVGAGILTQDSGDACLTREPLCGKPTALTPHALSVWGSGGCGKDQP